MAGMFRVILRRIFTPRRLLKLGGLMLGFFLFVGVMDRVVMPWYTKHGEALAVPNTIGKRFETAKEMLQLQGLKAVKAGERYDPRLPFGYVVEQNPRPNRLVKRGRRVYLVISVGEREVQVPNLIGLSETNALEQLKSFGLRVGEIEYEYRPDELPDVVIWQSHEPNSLVKVSTEVDITVSLGKPTQNVVVPSVLGKTLDVAKREIIKSGLQLGEVTFKFNNDFLPNTVIDQSLPAGQTVAHGDTINLLVTTVEEN